MYWRIIRINGDGTIRMIYDGTSQHANGESSTNRQVGTTAYNINYEDNAFIGYMNGTTNGTIFPNGTTNSISYAEAHANITNSTIKTYLEGTDSTDGWYKDNIIDTSVVFIQDTNEIYTHGTFYGGSGDYSEVNHGTADTTFTLTPNTFHVWDEVASLILDFGSETSGVANEFLFQFTSGSTATTLILPDNIKWANNSAPTIVENKIYQISVLKGLASVLEFTN
jgi:hypothetical protein